MDGTYLSASRPSGVPATTIRLTSGLGIPIVDGGSTAIACSLLIASPRAERVTQGCAAWGFPPLSREPLMPGPESSPPSERSSATGRWQPASPAAGTPGDGSDAPTVHTGSSLRRARLAGAGATAFPDLGQR